MIAAPSLQYFPHHSDLSLIRPFWHLLKFLGGNACVLVLQPVAGEGGAKPRPVVRRVCQTGLTAAATQEQTRQVSGWVWPVDETSGRGSRLILILIIFFGLY